MTIQIIGDVDLDRLYCTGSFTKMMTTFVCLSLLAEKFELNTILDDVNFLDGLCNHQPARDFLRLFQSHIGSRFSIRDICTYYTGLPYTFGLADEELENVEKGMPFKHHSILDEKTFLNRCHQNISMLYHNRCKFHYAELSIIFLGYFIETAYDLKIEDLYKRYVFEKFSLKNSLFSRTLPKHADVKDLSRQYDYPSIAILDHGYFCYSNGFYTNLYDQKILIERLLDEPVFHVMTDIHHARAASNRLMNGLTVELRLVNDDLIFGYEGLSFSGCNIWAYSTQKKQGYITTIDDEDAAYDVIYGEFGYTKFDTVPEHTETDYNHFISHHHDDVSNKPIPDEYIGSYHRVNINETTLDIIFSVGSDFIIIRNPDEIKYPVVCIDDNYYIRGKDGIHAGKVSLHRAESGNHYMMYDGTLYKKITHPDNG